MTSWDGEPTIITASGVLLDLLGDAIQGARAGLARLARWIRRSA